MYTTLTRKGSRCINAKGLQGYVLCTCRVSVVFEENGNLKSGNLSFIVSEDMSDERRRVILQRCF